MSAAQPNAILIVDFGSQVTQLIARRVREAGVYSEIVPFTQAEAAFRRMQPGGIILSGSPDSVPAEGSPRAPDSLFESGVPILGICYGQQVMSHQLGGEVRPGHETGETGGIGGQPADLVEKPADRHPQRPGAAGQRRHGIGHGFQRRCGSHGQLVR